MLPKIEITPDSLKEHEQAKIELCRKSYSYFVKEFWSQVPGSGRMRWNWHMDLICNELEAAANRVFNWEPAPYDLVINISPGSSKSTLCSILFQPWIWTRMPEARFINATHTHELVLTLASKSLRVLEGEKYKRWFPEIELCKSAMGSFANLKGGDRIACTVGGKNPMGQHGHFLIGDDLIDPQTVLSAVELNTAKEFVENDLPTRVVDKQVAVMILVMQRLGKGDPTDVMVDISKRDGGRPIRWISLPCDDSWPTIRPPELKERYREFNKDAGMESDGLMDPIRLPANVLKAFRARSTYKYAGQFGQAPTQPGGSMFKEAYFYLRPHVKAAPYKARRVRAWDRACLVAGTMVETRSGPKPIEKIKTGEYVLTRLGFKKVTWSGLTKYTDKLVSVEFTNGAKLIGTPDHLVWTENRGWVPLGSLDKKCYVLSNKQKENTPCRDLILEQKRLYLMGLHTEEKLAKGILKRGVKGQGTTICTGQYGGTTTEQGQLLGSMSALSVVKDLNRGMLMPVSPNTAHQDVTKKTKQRKEGKRKYAYSVGMNLRQSGTLGVVQLPVVQNGDGNRHQLRTNLKGSVKPMKQLGSVPVYDLTVEDAHEFFANGILVHNSILEGGCYTAGVLMAMDEEGDTYVEHMIHGQWDPDERNKIMVATAHRDRARYGPNYTPVIVIEHEGGSTGTESFRHIARKLPGFRILDYVVSGKGGKDTRAEPWADQLSAGTVVIVDDGTWDVRGFIDEHLAFRPEPGKRLGKFKDQIDACSMGYSYLAKKSVYSQPALKSFLLGAPRKLIRLAVMSRDQLATEIIDHRCILVDFVDPVETPKDYVYTNGHIDSLIPTHGINKLDDYLSLPFADLSPHEVQDKWLEPVQPWGKTPDQIVMKLEQGKKLWQLIGKKREPASEVILFVDNGNGDRRALSAAIAVADALRLPRNSCIWAAETPDNMVSLDMAAPNQHCASIIKATKGMAEQVYAK